MLNSRITDVDYVDQLGFLDNLNAILLNWR